MTAGYTPPNFEAMIAYEDEQLLNDRRAAAAATAVPQSDEEEQDNDDDDDISSSTRYFHENVIDSVDRFLVRRAGIYLDQFVDEHLALNEDMASLTRHTLDVEHEIDRCVSRHSVESSTFSDLLERVEKLVKMQNLIMRHLNLYLHTDPPSSPGGPVQERLAQIKQEDTD